MKKRVIKIAIVSALSVLTSMSYAQEFKKFSVSAGWLHVILILILLLKMEPQLKSVQFQQQAF
ncbi:hypothetical protein ACINWC141_2342 [Acinetobacter sp. WC-141]|nr:hypothetical protein ACINWC141_2342 [Acinetobacter sp. WC-141]